MTSISSAYSRPRSNSLPSLSYYRCFECRLIYQVSQQHFDLGIARSGICSWVCMKFQASRMNEEHITQALKYNMIFHREKNK